MLMKDFRELVKSTDPCSRGWKWFLRKTRKHKNTDTFFEECKNIKYDHSCYSSHGYLIYILRTCIDYSKSFEVGFLEGILIGYSKEYLKFIKNNFNVNLDNNINDYSIPIPELCNALKQAFSKGYLVCK